MGFAALHPDLWHLSRRPRRARAASIQLILSIRTGCALPRRLLECPIATQWERSLSRSITIRFDLKAGGHPEFLNIHKFRNFTEALSLELRAIRARLVANG